MWDRITESCSKAITIANEEAINLNLVRTGSEQLLLGISSVEDSDCAQLLTSINLTPSIIREIILTKGYSQSLYRSESTNQETYRDLLNGVTEACERDKEALKEAVKKLTNEMLPSSDNLILAMQNSGDVMDDYKKGKTTTVHLLLALIRIKESRAVEVIKELNVDLKTLENELKTLC